MTVLNKLKNRAAALYPKTTGAVLTVVGRALSREQRALRISFDGQDWIHTWNSGVFVSELPSPFPHHATNENLPLFLAHFVPSAGQTIVDVGAGVGTEVLAFSSLVGESGRVVCIEADPGAFRCLTKAVRLAELKNVLLLDMAVTDREGRIVLSQEEASVSNSVMVGSDLGVVVQTTTLDRLLDEVGVGNVDYLKMNIEGAEVIALEGFLTGPDRVRNWCISCHDFKQDPVFATFDRVRHWLDHHGLTVWAHERNDERPWESYYLHASADGQGE